MTSSAGNRAPCRDAARRAHADGDGVHRPWWQVLLLGLAAGSGGGLIGVGGGVIMVPVLTLWGLGQKRAQGTSLIIIVVAIAPMAILSYTHLGNVDFSFAVPLALGGALGGWTGSHLAQRFSNRVLGRAFGVFLILVALRMIFVTEPAAQEAGQALGRWELLEAGLLGLLGGMVAGFFGVGGGVVFVPTGVLLACLPQAVAQGSSFTAMLPTALAGAVGYGKKHEVAWELVRWLVPGALLGVAIGALGADIIPGRELRWLFACYLLYTGVRGLLGGGSSKADKIEDPPMIPP